MCTVSWIETPNGHELFFTRDELRSRGQGARPQPFTTGDTGFLAPTDSDSGGTWIAANAHGVSLCLLNHYPAGYRQPPTLISRGLLVKDLATSASVEQVFTRLAAMPLGSYAPFTLLAIDDQPPHTARWDGNLLEPATIPTQPLASSSRDAQAAGVARLRLWREMTAGQALDRDLCLRFHRSHEPERGALSPCMHRRDARSVSFTWIRSTANEIQMTYADGPPCCTELEETLRLPRTARATAAA